MLNKHLEITAKFLNETKLSLADARVRDAFLKDLFTKLKSVDENRTKIFVEYCDKDEEGNPIQEKPNTYSFKGDNIQKANDELTLLMDEKVELELTDKLKEYINQSDYKPLVGEAELIDEVLK